MFLEVIGIYTFVAMLKTVGLLTVRLNCSKQSVFYLAPQQSVFLRLDLAEIR